MAGFTLIELMLALILMAGMASILYGSLNLASRSWDGGEAEGRPGLRHAGLRLHTCAPSSPSSTRNGCGRRPSSRCCSGGKQNELRYAAVLPERVAGGGVYYFRLAVVGSGRNRSSCRNASFPIPRA
jgi:prepilin-type N-terminal cleavage/methylation domain-containing protein